MTNKKISINKISKVFMVVGVFFLITSIYSINKPVFYDDSFEVEESNIIVEQIRVLLGETIHIEISDFSGNVTVYLKQLSVVTPVASNVTHDSTFEVPFDYSVNIGLFIEAEQYSVGHLKAYVSGMSTALPIRISFGVLFIGLGIISEVIWRRRVSDVYLIDEERSIGFQMLLAVLIIIFPYLSGVGEREVRFVESQFGNQVYSWRVHLYTVLFEIVFNVTIVLVLLLFAIPFRRMVHKSQTKAYVSYPIDPMKQFRTRFFVYSMITLPVIIFFIVSSVLNRGSDYAGLAYTLSVYVPLTILVVLTVLCFLLIQILITDSVRKSFSIFLLPLLIFVSLVVFPKNQIPPIDLLSPPYDNKDPPLTRHVIYLLSVFLITVYLNIRIRKSQRFIPN